MRGTACIAGVTLMRGDGVRATAVAPMLELTRGVMFELMLGARDSTRRLGVRMTLCAFAGEPERQTNGNAAAINADRIRQVLISPAITPRPRLFARGRQPRYGVSTARLTIFSFCSLLNRAATSSLRIAPLPNCRRNMPSWAPPTIEA